MPGPEPREADATGRVVVCRDGDLAVGERRVIKVGRRRVGVFRVNATATATVDGGDGAGSGDGCYVALHGGCPHAGGALCEGPLTGTTLPADEPYTYTYGMEGQVLRCAWHGIEFDVHTGRSLVDPKLRARTYPVAVEDGAVTVFLRGVPAGNDAGDATKEAVKEARP